MINYETLLFGIITFYVGVFMSGVVVRIIDIAEGGVYHDTTMVY
jgi:hypothetical protein